MTSTGRAPSCGLVPVTATSATRAPRGSRRRDRGGACRASAGVYEPSQFATINQGEGRPACVSYLGFASLWLLIRFAVFGAMRLRRRRRPKVPLWPLVAPVVLVLVSAALFYGTPRFPSPPSRPRSSSRRWPAPRCSGAERAPVAMASPSTRRPAGLTRPRGAGAAARLAGDAPVVRCGVHEVRCRRPAGRRTHDTGARAMTAAGADGQRPRQDSNLRTRLRRPMLYPLSYEDSNLRTRLRRPMLYPLSYEGWRHDGDSPARARRPHAG